MATKTYIVTSEAGANLRLYPSGSYPTNKPVAHLEQGDTLNVITDWTSTNTVGSETTYLPVLHRDKVLYVAKELVETRTYLQRMEEAVKTVYPAIYSHNVRHINGKGTTLESILSGKATDCIGSVSACMAKAGLIHEGSRVGHTKADGKGGSTKNAPEKVIKGTDKLIKGTCTILKAGKCYKDLADKYKQAGMIYVQDSNICVSAGGGKIYSCNQTGKIYGKGHEAVLRTSGYPFTSKILYIIVPKG